MQDLGVDGDRAHGSTAAKVPGVSPLDDLTRDAAVQLRPGVGGLSSSRPGDGPSRARSVVIGAPLAIKADRFAAGDEFEAILRDVVARVHALQAVRP